MIPLKGQSMRLPMVFLPSTRNWEWSNWMIELPKIAMVILAWLTTKQRSARILPGRATINWSRSIASGKITCQSIWLTTKSVRTWPILRHNFSKKNWHSKTATRAGLASLSKTPPMNWSSVPDSFWARTLSEVPRLTVDDRLIHRCREGNILKNAYPLFAFTII